MPGLKPRLWRTEKEKVVGVQAAFSVDVSGAMTLERIVGLEVAFFVEVSVAMVFLVKTFFVSVVLRPCLPTM